MSAPDDDVPFGKMFAHFYAMFHADHGMNEREATLTAALMVAASMIAHSDEAIIAETFADLQPTMDQVHSQLDRFVEIAMRVDQAPKRGRP